MMTTKRAAKKNGVSRQTIIQWIKEGKIKAVKFGKRYVISHDEVGALDASIVVRTSSYLLDWLRTEAERRSMSLNLLINELIFASVKKGQENADSKKAGKADVEYGNSLGKIHKKIKAVQG
jgi:excisionase family DNA binding protein